MRNTTYVTVNGREYAVTRAADGYITISTWWEQIAFGQAGSARPRHEIRSRSVSTEGRLGKKILAALKEAA